MIERKGSSRRGFTLLETVMGLFVALTGVLTFASLMLLGNKVALQNKLRAIGYQVARQQIETFQDVPFESLGIGSGTLAVPESLVAQLPANSRTKYELLADWEVQSTSDPLIKRAVVRVRWKNAMSGNTTPTANSEVRMVRLLAMNSITGTDPVGAPITPGEVDPSTVIPGFELLPRPLRNAAKQNLADSKDGGADDEDDDDEGGNGNGNVTPRGGNRSRD